MSDESVPESFVMGTAPFCNASPTDCDEVPGFKSMGTVSGGCWSGNKYQCQFVPKVFLKTGPGRDLLSRHGADIIDYLPQKYFYYGTAPFCGADKCDVVLDGKFPIGEATHATGATCATGSKQIGMDPVDEFQREQVRKMAEECAKSRLASEEASAAKWKLAADALDMGAKAMGGIF